MIERTGALPRYVLISQFERMEAQRPMAFCQGKIVCINGDGKGKDTRVEVRVGLVRCPEYLCGWLFGQPSKPSFISFHWFPKLNSGQCPAVGIKAVGEE